MFWFLFLLFFFILYFNVDRIFIINIFFKLFVGFYLFQLFIFTYLTSPQAITRLTIGQNGQTIFRKLSEFPSVLCVSSLLSVYDWSGWLLRRHIMICDWIYTFSAFGITSNFIQEKKNPSVSRCIVWGQFNAKGILS